MHPSLVAQRREQGQGEKEEWSAKRMEEKGSVSVEVSNGIKIYTLKRGMMETRITEWGATIMTLLVPDGQGNIGDVVLGFDTLAPYQDGTSSPYFGAIVGRVANRIGGASFALNGKVYRTPTNNGPNTLHGGMTGFDKVRWQSSEVHDRRGPSVKFVYKSFDGEEGFPGDLEVSVAYTLSADLELRIDMEGIAGNKATPVNLANHTYWNLNGHGSGPVLDQKLQIFGTHITPVDDNAIPTGQISAVQGTPFDFSQETTIGSRIDQVPGPPPGGYDHNYVLSTGNPGEVRKAARVVAPKSGRVLEVYTDAPGVQFYSGNFLDRTTGKGGAVYGKHGALCLETQGFPDAVNHKGFPSVVLQPGEQYKHTDVYKFSTI